MGFRWLGIAVVTTFGLAALTGAAEPPAATAPGVLSPKMEAAFKQLSADSYATRQAATAAVQDALVSQFRALVAAHDPESEARIMALMAFDDGLARWIMDTMALPIAERTEILKWGLSPEGCAIIAKAYSTKTEDRADAARALAKIKGEQAAGLLARLLDDDEREVYLAAMEAVWDRTASPAMVRVLWARAVESSNFGMGIVLNGVAPQKFRGRVLPTIYNNRNINKAQDADVATEVLLNSKSPLLNQMIVSYLGQLAKNQMLATNMLMPYNQNSQNFFKLLDAYLPKEAVPILMKLATTSTVQKWNSQNYFASNRTLAIVAILKISDQQTEDFGLKRNPQMNNMWGFTKEGDEDEALKKLRLWWSANREKYTPAAGTQPTSAPGTAPSATP
jgi:hypothetical protein